MSERQFDMSNPNDREACMAAKWAETEQKLAVMTTAKNKAQVALNKALNELSNTNHQDDFEAECKTAVICKELSELIQELEATK